MQATARSNNNSCSPEIPEPALFCALTKRPNSRTGKTNRNFFIPLSIFNFHFQGTARHSILKIPSPSRNGYHTLFQVFRHAHTLCCLIFPEAMKCGCLFQYLTGIFVQIFRTHINPVTNGRNDSRLMSHFHFMFQSRYIQIQPCHGCTSFPVTALSSGVSSSWSLLLKSKLSCVRLPQLFSKYKSMVCASSALFEV